MNRQQINDLTMLGSVHETLIKNKDLFQNNPVFITTVSNFEEQLQQVKNLLVVQQDSKQISGAVHDKNMIRSFATDKCIRIISAIQAYAVNTSNYQLKAKVHYAPSDLKTKNDNAFYAAINVIYETALPIADVIKNYGISTILLSEFQNDISAFSKYLGLVKSMFGKQTTNTSAIVKAFRTIKTNLKNILDPLVKANFLGQTFAQNYFNARQTYKYGHPSTIIKGNISDINGHNIKHGKVELLNYPTNGTNTVRLTNGKGNFAFKKLTLNKIQMRISMEGYQSIEIEKIITEKKVNQFDFALQPSGQFQTSE